MRAVNLLPSDQLRVRKPVNRVALAGVASGAAIGMLSGAVFMNARAQVKDRTAVLEAAKAELASIPRPAAKPADETALVQERGARVSALTTALSGRVVWDRVLRQLASVLPEDVTLTRLSAKAPAAAGTPEAAAAESESSSSNGFQIEGYTYTQEGVALLLSRLQVLVDLRNVQLATSVAQTTNTTDQTVKFTITGSVARPGSPS